MSKSEPVPAISPAYDFVESVVNRVNRREVDACTDSLSHLAGS